MNFIYEQNKVTARIGNFLQHGFQALFKFTPELAPAINAPYQGDQLAVFERLGYITGNDASPSDDRSLTNTGSPISTGYSWCAGENLNRAANFIIPSTGSSLPARAASEVTPIFFQCRTCFWILVGHFLTPRICLIVLRFLLHLSQILE